MSIIQQSMLSLGDHHFISEYLPEDQNPGNSPYQTKYENYFFNQHCIDDDGFIYLSTTAGRSGGQYGYPASQRTRAISKLTPTGNVIETKKLTTIKPYFQQMVFVDNHIYGIGYATDQEDSSGNDMDPDALIIKFDKNLNIVWYRTLGNNSTDNQYDFFKGFAVDSSGNIYCGGSGSYQNDLYENGTYTYDTRWLGSIAVVKYNSSGTLQWKKEIRYGTGARNSNWDNAWGDGFLHVDSNDDLYVTGYESGANSGSSSDGTPDCGRRSASFAMKLNSSGNVTWAKKRRAQQTIQTGGPSSYTGCYHIYGRTGSSGVDSNGNLYHAHDNWQMSSTSWNNGNSGYATSIVKRNSSGTVQWERCWYIDPSIHGYNGGSTVSSALQILFDADDNVYLCMRQGKTSNYDRPILIFKWNSSGTLQWARKISRTNLLSNNWTPYPWAFKIDPVKKYFTVSGYTKDPSDTKGDGATLIRGYVIKLPLDGSKTGTYGNWTYAAENEFTFSQTFLGNSITGVDATSNLTTYTSTMVDNRYTLAANAISMGSGAVGIATGIKVSENIP